MNIYTCHIFIYVYVHTCMRIYMYIHSCIMRKWNANPDMVLNSKRY